MEISPVVQKARRKVQALVAQESPFDEVAPALDELDAVTASPDANPMDWAVGVCERVVAYEIYKQPEEMFLPVFERYLTLCTEPHQRATAIMSAAVTYPSLRPRVLEAIEELEAIEKPDKAIRETLETAYGYRKRHGF